jgi:cob(I)alamin adenosyltransferase
MAGTVEQYTQNAGAIEQRPRYVPVDSCPQSAPIESCPCNAGLIHVYTGNGKGKTTAVVGLACRCWGSGRNVIFTQFLKSGKTGELQSLKTLEIPLIRSEQKFGFTFRMTDEAKQGCRAEQRAIISRLDHILKTEVVDLAVLDEVLDAVSTGMLDEAVLRDFLQNKPEHTEIALSGRPVPPWLMEMADYVSDIQKIKHPFDKGITAREGIER